MSFEREAFARLLEDSYSAYYNIIKEENAQTLPMIFRADYFQRSEAYWFSKSNKMYANETNEFTYVFSAEAFDEDTAKACIQFALDDGLPRVKPNKEHQYTNIKTIFIANEFSPEAIKAIEKTKFQKTYNHSLWGYSDLLNSAVDVDNEKVYANRAGYKMKSYFKKLFAAQKK